MQCSTCGFTLQEGAAFCPNCGAKMSSQGNAGNPPVGPSQVEPTVLASSSYQPPSMNPSPNQQAVPPTAYGEPYSTPQGYSSEAPPPPPPANVYGAPYAGTPYPPAPGSYYPPGQPPTPPTRRKGPGVGLIIGIIVLVLLVVGGGLVAIVIHAASSSSTTNTVTPTTAITATPAVTPTIGATPPSGAQIDPTAATIITRAKTTSSIDSNYFPTHVTSNFAVGQEIYLTFNLATNGQPGYVEVKWYLNTSFVLNKILTVQSNFDHGYFGILFKKSGPGAGELYWCTQSDCSDAKLATFVTFTVS